MCPNLHYFIFVTMESLQSWYTGTHGLLQCISLVSEGHNLIHFKSPSVYSNKKTHFSLGMVTNPFPVRATGLSEFPLSGGKLCFYFSSCNQAVGCSL